MTKMTARTIRVDDELWSTATAKAGELGISVSDVIRHALNRLTGNYAGAEYSGASVSIMGGSIVLSDEWNDADPEESRFHMIGCDVELRGLDLWISPAENPPTAPTELKAAAIAGSMFRSPTKPNRGR